MRCELWFYCYRLGTELILLLLLLLFDFNCERELFTDELRYLWRANESQRCRPESNRSVFCEAKAKGKLARLQWAASLDANYVQLAGGPTVEDDRAADLSLSLRLSLCLPASSPLLSATIAMARSTIVLRRRNRSAPRLLHYTYLFAVRHRSGERSNDLPLSSATGLLYQQAATGGHKCVVIELPADYELVSFACTSGGGGGCAGYSSAYISHGQAWRVCKINSLSLSFFPLHRSISLLQ